MADFQALRNLMVEAGLPDAAVRAFQGLYSQLQSGEAGLIGESDIAPAEELTAYVDLLSPDADTLRNVLSKTVVIKLNGGLGTSMGLEGPKSLLPVKADLTFLDIIARQVLWLRKKYNVEIPCLLMNSFRTHSASLECMAKYADFAVAGLPIDFMQHKVPKIVPGSLEAVSWPAKPELEWCPPGHGDLYAAVETSGVLGKLLDRGYEYAFVSNSDNLGAVLDEAILFHFASQDLPFMMEVTARTAADRKGGHLAKRRCDGQLVLREKAQCPAEEEAEFQNICKYTFFNTNNLWLNLKAVQSVISEHGYVPLPMIRNEKCVDPSNKKSPRVIQLESAMGAAIEVFKGAAALDVPRTRFAPVKQCSDLLAVWSDAYCLRESFCIALHPDRQGRPPELSLDDAYYSLVSDLSARFPQGAPSLLACSSLEITGDILFGKDVLVRGDASVTNTSDTQKMVPDRLQIEGHIKL